MTEILRPRDVTAEYGIPEGHLQKLRAAGNGPRFSKPTRKMILYRRLDIEAWLDRHCVTSTAQVR